MHGSPPNLFRPGSGTRPTSLPRGGHWPSAEQPVAERAARGAPGERRPTILSKLRMGIATVSGVVLVAGAVGAGVAVADASPAPSVQHSVTASALQDKADGEWLIVTHHSSVVPEASPRRTPS